MQEVYNDIINYYISIGYDIEESINFANKEINTDKL